MSVVTHMSGGFKDWANPTYDEVAMASRHIAKFVHHSTGPIHKVEAIVGIARGGLVMGVQLSNMLNLPLKTVYYSAKGGKGNDKNHKNHLPEFEEKNLLLVDDICDSGHTLNEICEVYRERGHEVSTAVVYFKDHGDNTIHTPDIWAVKISKNFGWVTFPFEHKLE